MPTVSYFILRGMSMKYRIYVFTTLFKLYTKISIYLPLLFTVIGFSLYQFDMGWEWFTSYIIWIHLCIAYMLRGYSTHVVFNYVLENNIWLPRLLERKYVLNEEHGIYYPTLVRNSVKLKGYLVYEKISKLKYTLVLWLLWIWVDNDSGRDTASQGFTEKLANGEVWKWLPNFIRNFVKKELEYMKNNPNAYGNAWELGDARKDMCPEWYWIASIYWIIRNTAYNFNYMFEECSENDPKYFYIEFPKLGWHFGYIPYTNSERKGRMVWFSEDYDKLDKNKK